MEAILMQMAIQHKIFRNVILFFAGLCVGTTFQVYAYVQMHASVSTLIIKTAVAGGVLLAFPHIMGLVPSMFWNEEWENSFSYAAHGIMVGSMLITLLAALSVIAR